MAEYEYVISGGLLVDGTGAPGVEGDLAVDAGRIAAIGGTGTLRGRDTVDATGRIVAPGFIDLHSHADFSAEGWPEATTQLHQGVTTLVTGNCGWSPFPVGSLEGLRAATAFLHPEISWRWTGAGDFADVVDGAAPAINLALQVGHSSLRLAAMGDADRAPTPAELDAMLALLRRCAADGVFGFSTGLIYAPGAFAAAAEVRALVAEAAAADLLYSTHMRNESSALIDAVVEAIAAAEDTGARLEVSHLKAMGPENHGAVVRALELIDAARERGVDVTADVYPYTASSTTLTSRLATWAMDGGTDGLLRRLADPGERERVADALRARFGRDVDPEGVVLAALPDGPYSADVGSSIADIGRRDGVDPAEAALRVLAAHQGAVSIVNHAMSEADVTAALRHPQVSVASDGWVMRPTGEGRPHPRSFGTFTRVLGHYVRDSGVLDWPEAVRKMTALPAARLGLTDRGRLAPGLVADIAVFDPATVAEHSTFADPWRLSTGFDTVLVAGRPVLADGVPTGERPGAVLRKSRNR
ncbi:N-acyl-D-amino-acid deacylase [Murinocardiopsis flavida]|uniref:N-acyl-D-amino-acid deacylase n=1 Tax=Murinocardiopsis flavida TaxID=645275 RepID=A0A2P8CVE1_9ACTN|nr:D-aminoacylase [Murinocardiopsis flavida]PSK88922.1 N-acyl-D-amino-acid deacylase [Murinocardiopsis flavida]